jgi:hypothetical protein
MEAYSAYGRLVSPARDLGAWKGPALDILILHVTVK